MAPPTKAHTTSGLMARSGLRPAGNQSNSSFLRTNPHDRHTSHSTWLALEAAHHGARVRQGKAGKAGQDRSACWLLAVRCLLVVVCWCWGCCVKPSASPPPIRTPPPPPCRHLFHSSPPAVGMDHRRLLPCASTSLSPRQTNKPPAARFSRCLA
jgi:hypothetical protein